MVILKYYAWHLGMTSLECAALAHTCVLPKNDVFFVVDAILVFHIN